MTHNSTTTGRQNRASAREIRRHCARDIRKPCTSNRCGPSPSCISKCSCCSARVASGRCLDEDPIVEQCAESANHDDHAHGNSTHDVVRTGHPAAAGVGDASDGRIAAEPARDRRTNGLKIHHLGAGYPHPGGDRSAHVSRAQSRVLRAPARAAKGSTIRLCCRNTCARRTPTPTRSDRAVRARRLRRSTAPTGASRHRSCAPHSDRWRDRWHQPRVFDVRTSRQTDRVHHRRADVRGFPRARDAEPARSGVQRRDGQRRSDCRARARADSRGACGRLFRAVLLLGSRRPQPGRVFVQRRAAAARCSKSWRKKAS